MDAAPATESVPDRLARALARPEAWPPGSPAPEWIQTHISHVFLVGDRVYKLRKAARLPFLDFGTREARNADCLREIALNRRLAASVYLGVAPVADTADAVRVGELSEEIGDPDAEHVVVMRRLTDGRDALSLLERGELTPDHLESVAERLQHFHAGHGLGSPAPWSAAAWRERIAEPILASLTSVIESGLVPEERMHALVSRTRAVLDALTPRFEQRRLEGRAVDGHGDTHLQHIWFEDGDAEPLLIDCIEFDEDLRTIDCASEVAFLAMDLRYRGRNDLAEGFLADYAARADDYGLFPVVDLFAAYRALVRAKVAGLAVQQASIAADQREKAKHSALRHLTLAEALLEPGEPGSLLLMCGTVGSGKSSVARRLARSGAGTPISADRVRKALPGLAPETGDASGLDEGLYDPALKDRVYRELLERAADVVASGRTAILDASYTRRAWRDEARAWAAERKLPVRLVEVRCAPDVARARLHERRRAGRDPSDAGPELLDTSLARFEPPDEWPAEDRRVISTDHEGWQATLTHPDGADAEP